MVRTVIAGTIFLLATLLTPARSAESTPQGPSQKSFPVGIGQPHSCSSYEYPRSAIVNRAQGTTTLRFTIGVDGIPSDIGVAATSGNADLDRAAIACASTWRYTPAVSNGAPVAVPWVANIAWKLPTVIPPVGYNPSAHQCASVWILAYTRAATEFDTVLSFWVDTDGSVKALRVSQSSGDRQIDDGFAKCVSSWVYTPATRNDAPIRAVWEVRFRWDGKAAVGMLEGPLRPHTCAPLSYPPDALENKAEGTTVLTFRIVKEGLLDQIRVSQSSGNHDLDEASTACAATWRYEPIRKEGRIVESPWAAQITWTRGFSIVAELGNGDEPP